MAEQSLAITPNCVQQTSPNYVAGTSIGCGVQKVGLHWAENAQFPFPIGDSTISVETARLILTAMVGGYTLETLSLPALAGPNPYLTALPQYNIFAIAKYPPTAFPPIGVVNNGITRTLVWVNDGVNPGDNAWGASGSYPSLTQTVTVNINSWGLPLGTKLIHSVAAAGYMGEIYTWPLVVGGPNLTVTVPPFSTSTIIAPLTPQTETVLSATEDATLKAGVNQNTNFGAAPTLSVSTSVTSTHDSTSAAMIKFTIPAGLTQVVVAVLELTVMTPPTADMQMIIVGLDPTSSANGGPVSWADATATWASAVNVFTSTPTSQISSIAQNFLQLASGNVIAGHVTVPANTPAGTTRRVDVTAFVRVAAAAYGNATFVLSRRWRNNAASGNAGGSIAADNLSLGAVTTFFSKESAAGGTGPALRLYTPTTALQLQNQAPSSQLSLSSSIGLSGYTLDTFGPTQQSTFLAVTSNQLSVPPSNIAIAGLAAPTASGRRALLQAGLNSSAVSINISITVNHPTPTGANALAGAISTGLTELTGPAGSPALVSSLKQAGLGKASGTALTVQPTVRSKNGTDIRNTINKFFSVLHLNMNLANDTCAPHPCPCLPAAELV